MKKNIILIYSLILAIQIHASPQSEDYLIVGNEGHFIRANPLNTYLSYFCKEERLADYVNNFCAPNWPNYTRHWEIKDKRLYLVKIETDTQEKYPLELLFPRYDGSPVEATWFSGIMSYQLDNSPLIQLNHEYYEDEMAIRAVKGKIVEKYKINHRERWISYSKQFLGQYRPLAAGTLASPNPDEGMIEFLEDLFSFITHPKEKPSVYFPSIQIKFNADLDEFQLTEAHRELSCYELLETIAAETQTTLNVTLSNRVVIYEIKENELPASRPPKHAEGGTPSQ